MCAGECIYLTRSLPRFLFNKTCTELQILSFVSTTKCTCIYDSYVWANFISNTIQIYKFRLYCCSIRNLSRYVKRVAVVYSDWISGLGTKYWSDHGIIHSTIVYVFSNILWPNYVNRSMWISNSLLQAGILFCFCLVAACFLLICLFHSVIAWTQRWYGDVQEACRYNIL